LFESDEKKFSFRGVESRLAVTQEEISCKAVWVEVSVLDFRYIFALSDTSSNYGANCLQHGMKNCANFVFFGPVRLRGHFEEIGIAIEILLNIN